MESTQKGDVIQQRGGDPLWFGDFLDSLGWVLTFSHLILVGATVLLHHPGQEEPAPMRYLNNLCILFCHRFGRTTFSIIFSGKKKKTARRNNSSLRVNRRDVIRGRASL